MNMAEKYLSSIITGDYIGEIRLGKDIGRSNLNQPYKWNPCPDCGTPKWSHVCKGEVHHTLCKKCVYTRAHREIIDKHTGKPRGNRPDILPTTKFCYKCKRELPLNSFYKGNDSYLGVRSACIECGKTEHKLWVKTENGINSNRKASKRSYYTEKGVRRRKEYIESGKRQQNLERQSQYYKDMVNKPSTKICTVCKQDLPLTNYRDNIGGKYGLKSSCRKCEVNLEILYRQTDKGKRVSREYRESDRYKERTREYNATYIKPEKTRLNNKRLKQTEKYKLKAREYAKSPQSKERKKLYYQTELGKACIARCSHNRRVRNKAVPATLTVTEWNEIKKRYKYRCVYCGEKKPLTRDHIIPLSKNGPLTKENVVPACKSCNSKKLDKPVLLQILAMDKPKEIVYTT
jgi:hypothetical protein